MKKEKKAIKIDFSRKRLERLTDKYYVEGDFLSSLTFAYRQLQYYGGTKDLYARLADVYEGMNLQGMAINWWFRFLDLAEEYDLPDVYEGLAVNYLSMGQDSTSAYYYNQLIDVDDTLPDETKLDIAEAFSVPKKERFRFVYPPRLADYSEEVRLGAKALKEGACAQAVETLSKVEKGSKQFAHAKEMQAVAHLLEGDTDAAKEACEQLLKEYPDDVRAIATLAAVYIEKKELEKSKELALRLSKITTEDPEELYKIATVCCENDLPNEAYEKLCLLDKKTPYDGRILYFKAVSAYKSGRLDKAIEALETIRTIYPDAEVAKYYLKELKAYKEYGGEAPELIYFYHLPQEEREHRCQTLMRVCGAPKDEAEIFGIILEEEGYFRWCFDEMDGGDQELQYLGLVAAAKVNAEAFIRDVLLDYEVADVLKIETLRMLLERNEEGEFGFVLYNIYKKVRLPRISIGRKRRKKFIEAFAKVASKFVALKDSYGEKIKRASETLYRALEGYGSLDLVDSVDDCACAIFMMTGLKELGNNPAVIASAFDANMDKVKVLLAAALSDEFGVKKEGQEE